MNKKMILAITLSMILLGVFCGYALCRFTLETPEDVVVYCLLMGGAFGLLNAGTAILFIRKYNVEKKENTRLVNTIRMDSLTGLFNRLAFEIDMKKLSPSGTYAAIFLDIDNFGVVNKQLGHQAGDEILRVYGSLILDNIRETDSAYRYGGDEIFILLQNCNSTDAVEIARKIINKISVNCQFQEQSATITAGVASYPEPVDDISKLLEASDQAMRKAKQLGKNRVAVYTDS